MGKELHYYRKTSPNALKAADDRRYGRSMIERLIAWLRRWRRAR